MRKIILLSSALVQLCYGDYILKHIPEHKMAEINVVDPKVHAYEESIRTRDFEDIGDISPPVRNP